MTTLGQWLKKDFEIPYRDRESILQYVLKKKRVDLYTSLSQPLSLIQIQECEKITNRYKEGYPLAYLTGEVDFYKHMFLVGEGVFIPRLETEILVDQVLKKYSDFQHRSFSIMDFGSGSGCIGLSLLKYFTKAHLFAVDVSSTALQWTEKNAKALDVSSRVSYIHQDVAQLHPKDFPSIQWITANPPYIAREDKALSPLVEKYEPHGALFADNEGLHSIEVWLKTAVHFLHNSSNMHPQSQSYFFEIGYDQSNKVSQLLKKYSQIREIQWYSDHQGIQRVVHCSF